ncbi:MAG: hypothetical protein P9X27_00570 [Candidatus Kaelpia aquatica]|nr:hypothetical protein [Candidatus Kaelpia aquatica]
MDTITKMLIECRSKFFTFSLATNKAKVDFLVSTLDVTIEEIGEFIVDLALPVEGTLAFNNGYYGRVILFDSSVKSLTVKTDLLKDILGVDTRGDDMLVELKPIISLNSGLCSFIAKELYDELDELEGCGEQIAKAYSEINRIIKARYDYTAYQMLSTESVEIIAGILEEYKL